MDELHTRDESKDEVIDLDDITFDTDETWAERQHDRQIEQDALLRSQLRRAEASYLREP